MRYATGIVQHPITQRWQSWVYTEDDHTISLACLSSHSSKAQAHLVARIVRDAYLTHSVVDLPHMLAQNQESDVPDPLPQDLIDTLIALIDHYAQDGTPYPIFEI